MCMHVCTSMYVGGSATEPRRPSRMSTKKSGIEAAGLESSDYHAPADVEAARPPSENPISMASADLVSYHVI